MGPSTLSARCRSGSHGSMDKQTSVLVAYASKHGSTRGIAESIAETLRQRGAQVDVRPVSEIDNLGDYDAYVIGSAVYFGFWRKEAVRFVKRNTTVLASRPVWMFSSGPLGTETTDPQGRDLRSVAEPKVIVKFRSAIAPRDHRVFFGALDLSKLGIAERAVTKMPLSRDLFSEGDFRDQADIRAWATGIAQALDATQGAAS
jgi:menaquinone-dependent protoporphyrinogen oxidase